LSTREGERISKLVTHAAPPASLAAQISGRRES
jgi:hypothetical protein